MSATEQMIVREQHDVWAKESSPRTILRLIRNFLEGDFAVEIGTLDIACFPYECLTDDGKRCETMLRITLSAALWTAEKSQTTAKQTKAQR